MQMLLSLSTAQDLVDREFQHVLTFEHYYGSIQFFLQSRLCCKDGGAPRSQAQLGTAPIFASGPSALAMQRK